jgi:hypothetical protein
MNAVFTDFIEKINEVFRGIRSFLGHAGFYRWSTKDFSKVFEPLTNLSKNISLFPLMMIVLNLLKLLRNF